LGFPDAKACSLGHIPHGRARLVEFDFLRQLGSQIVIGEIGEIGGFSGGLSQERPGRRLLIVTSDFSYVKNC